MCLFGFRKKILKLQEETRRALEESEKRHISDMAELKGSVKTLSEGLNATLNQFSENIKNINQTTVERLGEVKGDVNSNLAEIRQNMEKSLREVREDNEKQLAAMRGVVEEKLEKSLGERLNATFDSINKRLDEVNKGLGEMQVLSGNVTDLKRVLSNVKTRGNWGEVSLKNLIDEILTEQQYTAQKVLKNGREKVDFAISLPGSGDGEVYLPIDVKFPIESYQRLVEASEAGNAEGARAASKELEVAVKNQAKSIKEKYVNPPETTDFAVMYLPIEGLYAEVVRKTGLIEELQQKYRIIPAGPTTISALLNSLQMGFQTLQIQKSSKEIFRILSQFRQDFGKFLDIISKAQENVRRVENSLNEATQRTDLIRKRLDKVDNLQLPSDDTGTA